MLPSLSDAVPFLLAFLLPFLIVMVLMPWFMGFLRRRGRVASDAHKKGETSIPTPAGPLLVLSLIAGEAVVFAFYGTITAPVLVAVIGIAGAVGLYDDLRGLGGIVKPALLLAAAVPMVVAEAAVPYVYSPTLYFPLFTRTGTHFIIFAIIVVASLPVASNAFNMLDAFNGEIAAFTLIVSLALIVGMSLRSYELQEYRPDRIALALPLVAVSLAFYFYNRYPSRVFDGDSGSLALGATYAALAVIGGVEIAALVAVIPAILNSYYILSSVRGLVERKMMKGRPTYMGEDGRLYASREPGSPTTLARMILLGGPMGERELVRSVIILTLFAAALSVVTSVMTWLL